MTATSRSPSLQTPGTPLPREFWQPAAQLSIDSGAQVVHKNGERCSDEKIGPAYTAA